MEAGKLVQAAHAVSDHGHNDEFGEAWEGNLTVYTGPEALLNRVDGPFDFAEMTVCRHDVHFDWTELFADALKLVVGVYVANVRTRVI